MNSPRTSASPPTQPRPPEPGPAETRETNRHDARNEIDFGTPASPSTELVTLEVDGVSVTVPAGTSVMRAAMQAQIAVPKLCATDSLEAFGSCRLCLVEIEGAAAIRHRAPRRSKPA